MCIYKRSGLYGPFGPLFSDHHPVELEEKNLAEDIDSEDFLPPEVSPGDSFVCFPRRGRGEEEERLPGDCRYRHTKGPQTRGPATLRSRTDDAQERDSKQTPNT